MRVGDDGPVWDTGDEQEHEQKQHFHPLGASSADAVPPVFLVDSSGIPEPFPLSWHVGAAATTHCTVAPRLGVLMVVAAQWVVCLELNLW